MAGGTSFGTSYRLDGAMHNNPYDNFNMPLPFPDALQEFKVETSALTAQNGVHSGAAVNAVTKSGTNNIHGDAFEFIRNGVLTRATFSRTDARYAEAQSIRRDDWRSGHAEQAVLLRRYSGNHHAHGPADQLRFCADRCRCSRETFRPTPPPHARDPESNFRFPRGSTPTTKSALRSLARRRWP